MTPLEENNIQVLGLNDLPAEGVCAFGRRAAQRFVVSGDGGDHPVWRRDGAELFIVDPTGQLRSVSVRWSRDGVPSFGLPSKLSVPAIGRGHWGTPYDVSADGSRIYFLRRNDDPSPGEIHVVVGWRALLERP